MASEMRPVVVRVRKQPRNDDPTIILAKMCLHITVVCLLMAILILLLKASNDSNNKTCGKMNMCSAMCHNESTVDKA
ncbi:Protein of unknown function [Gryllus bimaculatus]|nr:Protein of unknown function [Gryllus bimaculatus]